MVFMQAGITGMILRLVYRSVSCFRQLVRHSRMAVEAEDFVYWISAAVYVFVQIYYTSDGSIRWNFVLGIVVGVALSSVFLKKTENMHKKIYDKKEKKFSENVAKKSKKRYD